uniref:Uncharacterized protein LOC105852994 n=1 Tax=Rhizophora mucronata TaxID=61149 RepID=A0A2P2MKP4_RHIMU
MGQGRVGTVGGCLVSSESLISKYCFFLLKKERRGSI